MSSAAIEVRQSTALEGIKTANDVRAQVNLVQEIMRGIMKENVHFGTIPGCKKPSLWKPGSEILLSTFRIGVEPIVEDLSGPDEARFRVSVKATSMESGRFLGMGIGECSSSEEKYMWRRSICDQEWESTPANERQKKWKRGKDNPWQEKQVRMNIADVRNTVLKMAKKRAQIDVTLTVTAASDIFDQDIEDMPEEFVVEKIATPAPVQPVQRKSEAVPAQPAPQQTAEPQGHREELPFEPPTTPKANGNGDYISEKQGKRFFAIYHQNGWNDQQASDLLKERWGVGRKDEIPKSKYDDICTFFAASRQ